jgi:hypothetical protein
MFNELLAAQDPTNAFNLICRPSYQLVSARGEFSQRQRTASFQRCGIRNNSVIDTAVVQKQAQDLVQYYMAHSEATVMDAAKSVFNVTK